MLETSHRPDGKVADMLALTHACTTAANASVNFRMYVPQRTLKTSHRPNGKQLVDMSISILIFGYGCCLDLPACSTCQPRLQTSHRPDGKMADALASTLACATANASVNYRWYVPHNP